MCKQLGNRKKSVIIFRVDKHGMRGGVANKELKDVKDILASVSGESESGKDNIEDYYRLEKI